MLLRCCSRLCAKHKNDFIINDENSKNWETMLKAHQILIHNEHSLMSQRDASFSSHFFFLLQNSFFFSM